jgi:hypothetical protein
MHFFLSQIFPVNEPPPGSPTGAPMERGAERIASMKNSNDTIGNRTRDLSARKVVRQPTALQPVPIPSQGTPRISLRTQFVTVSTIARLHWFQF